MKRLDSHVIGIDEGDPVLFSDYETEGEMWTGRGARERRRFIKFSQVFKSPPVVHVSLSMWDMDTTVMLRGDIQAEMVTEEGFDLVFRTWGDSRVARARIRWIAIGELPAEDDWELY